MIKEFDGIYAFLSNFWTSPIEFEGIVYPTNEHFFQAMKTLDPKARKAIAAAPTPGKAKRMGRNVQLRADWEQVKEEIMLRGLRLKFKDPHLRISLLMTGDQELIEGNWWHDNTWGNCSCERCHVIHGRNLLGKLLMKVRQEIKEELA